VELLEPEQGVGHKEVAYLTPAEVEDERAPIGLLTSARVRMLVQRRAVESGQGLLVLREVSRHPVDDDSDPGLM